MSVFLLVAESNAHATDQGITGKKLLLKSNPKMVLLSKDGAVVPGATGSSADPRCLADGGSGSGASVTLSKNGFDTVTLSMPCANWSANSAGTLYKYKDTTGTPKVGKIKDGLLTVISPGMGGFPVPNGVWTVTAEVAIGTDKYCMSFSGTGDGDKFLVKDQAGVGTCAVSQTCGNNVREGTEICDGTDSCPQGCSSDCSSCPPIPCQATTGGFCWFLGGPGVSCDQWCTVLFKTCDQYGTIDFAGYPVGSLANCVAVMEAFAVPAAFADANYGNGVGCGGIPGPVAIRDVGAPTTCAAARVGYERACACQ